MTTSIRNILYALTFVILLPIAAFTIMEVSKLNENEEVLDRVYREQLDAIIFSINQYSGDLLSFYINQIELEWIKSNNTSIVDSLLMQQNLAIAAIALQTGDRFITSRLLSPQNFLLETQFDSILTRDPALVDRLIRYKETNYIKPEPLGEITVDNQLLNVIMVIIGEDNPCLMFLNPVLFIEDLLAPRIQQIATQDLDVTVRHVPTDAQIYSNAVGQEGIIQTRKLWLLPNYELGVSLRGDSIQDIISYRTNRNIISLAVLLILIIVGSVLVIRNLRKEMQLSKAKADFVANVSHEIRTPLSLISMFNETLLLDRVTDENKKREYYEIISKETSRLKTIVNKILSFSQIDADKKIYDFQLISPDKEIREVVNNYSYHLKDKGFEHHTKLNSENTSIRADKAAFVEVIINLIDNAIKYSSDVKYLAVKSYNDDKHYSIEIADKGVGIEPAKQRQVFEKFYRITESNLYETKGTGLGLSLVAAIMKAHGGKVELESAPGKGSTFKLIFNLQDADKDSYR